LRRVVCKIFKIENICGKKKKEEVNRHILEEKTK
jgi:hypothetical protein